MSQVRFSLVFGRGDCARSQAPGDTGSVGFMRERICRTQGTPLPTDKGKEYIFHTIATIRLLIRTGIHAGGF